MLLTNFSNYVNMFAEKFNVDIDGKDRPMQSATSENITIINFGMGSAMAATLLKGIGGNGQCHCVHVDVLMDRVGPIEQRMGAGVGNGMPATLARVSHRKARLSAISSHELP